MNNRPWRPWDGDHNEPPGPPREHPASPRPQPEPQPEPPPLPSPAESPWKAKRRRKTRKLRVAWLELSDIITIFYLLDLTVASTFLTFMTKK